MHIHHSKIRQATEIGCHLSIAKGQFRIFWPKYSLELLAHTADEAIRKMRDTQEGLNMLVPELMNDETHINGVSKDGGIAYREGVPASDCPYLEEDPDFDRWNNEWDEAADAAEIEDKPPQKGSVVTNRYRANYSESGHPTHCGDELAITLNTICLNKAGINMELFEAICETNGVNLTKYNRTTKGWQGRLRMTGRNLLASRVRENGGILFMPRPMEPDFYQLSQEWVDQAATKYKPKAVAG